jgi:glycosyltransferase involved in cell wall biosynthesis
MPRFSLIVGTKDRTEEFAVLLQSLAVQQMRDFELIVVDQNADDRLTPLLKNWAAQVAEQQTRAGGSVQLKHLRCHTHGVSRARNLGLMHSSGDILAFPDDDCWYLSDTLQRVDEWFRQHEGYGILSIGSRDEQGRISGNRWAATNCDLTKLNIFRASVTYAYFVRRPQREIPFHFDESLGPGSDTKFGAGDDTDFLLSLLRHGILGRFYSVLHVGHPLKGYIDRQRAERYGGGWGRVAAKHSLPLLGLGFIVFDFARAALRMVVGDRDKASLLYAHGRGIIGAYFSR